MNMTLMNTDDWKVFRDEYPAAYNRLARINNLAEIRSINHQIDNGLYYDSKRLDWLKDRLATLTHFD